MYKIIFAVLVLATTQSQAQYNSEEPAYCKLQNFMAHDITPQVDQLATIRLHAFQFGKAKLIGLAVGLSLPNYVEKLARLNSTATENEKFCTWYFNKWNWIAEEKFNWKYLPKPGQDAEKAAEDYENILATSFDQDIPSFISCLENQKFLAMGCNNQQHRGPSVFAMLLAYSGCNPSSATDIANSLWGLNGIPYKTRLAIAQKGFEMGRKNSIVQFRLQQIFFASAERGFLFY